MPQAEDEMDGMYPSESPEGMEAEEPEGEMPEEGMPPAEEAPPSIDQENAEGATAVLDNKMLKPDGVLKEGDEFTVVVVKNYGDESEVRLKPVAAVGAVQPPEGMEAGMKELDAMGAEGGY